MFELLKKEFSDRRTSLLIYCVVVVSLLWLYVSIYPSIREASAQLDKLLQSYPKGFLQAFNIKDLTFDTLEKFIAIEQFTFTWPILAIALALSRAGNAISGEVEKGTMGLYLSLPVWRPNIFLAKYMAGLLAITIFSAISVLITIPLASLYHISVQPVWFFNTAVICLLFMWAVFAVGMMFSALFNERSRVYLTVGGVLIIMYAMNVAASLKSSLLWLRDYSVFNYFNAQEVLSQHIIRLSTFWVFGAVIMIATILGVLIFSRRDISV